MIFSRTEMLLGKDNIEKLSSARVVVFGVGGVGSYAVEALARCGIGHLLLVDDDTIAKSNINRQLHAMHSTVGLHKTEVMAQRARDINPDINVETRQQFCLPENVDSFLQWQPDYIIDAIDTVSAKIALAKAAGEAGISIISAMGAGNKLDPTRFEVADINETSVCPLCRVMRRELKRQGVYKLKVVYSRETVITPASSSAAPDTAHQKRQTPGSIAFVPSVVGLIAAGEVVRDLCEIKR